MGRALSAELYGIRHRGSFTAVSVVWLLQIVLFAYLVNYIVAMTVTELPADAVAAMKESLLPSTVAGAVTGSLPMYGGPVMVILGALIGAGDERSGVIRTVLSRCPERGRLIAAKSVALTLLVGVVMVVTFIVAFLCSMGVSLIDGAELVFPTFADVAVGFGSSWLIGTTWAMFGLALAVITRSLAGAIAIGLLWGLVVEQALHGLAMVAAPLEAVRAVLLSGASSVLAEATGSSDGAMPMAAPDAGVPLAIVVLAGWITVSAVVSVTVFRRRDVQ